MLRGLNIIYGILVVIVFVISGCSEEKDDYIKEGLIEYKIGYTENSMQNMATSLLPKKMVLRFNSDYSKTSIDGFMGMFNITLITDFKNKKDVTLIKFIDKKYVNASKRGEYSCIFNYMPKLEIFETDSVVDVCGYECKYAKVINTTLPDESFDVLYTNQIGAKKPNFNNPYSDLQGVLLQFHLQLGNVKMELIADKVENVKVSNEDFAIPEEFKMTSKKNMDILLDKILEN